MKNLRNTVWQSAWIARMISACLVVIAMTATSEAQLHYDFIEDGTGDVIATLELSGLPATHLDVNGLSFTSKGETIFGFGPAYTGTFDSTNPGATVIDDGVGGLMGAPGFAFFRDLSPPMSSIPGLMDTVSFSLNFDNGGVSALDTIALESEMSSEAVVVGHFQIVPEPSYAGLCMASLLACAVVRRRMSQSSEKADHGR